MPVMIKELVRLAAKGTKSLMKNGPRHTMQTAKRVIRLKRLYASLEGDLVPAEEELARQRAECENGRLLISVLVPLYNTPESFLRDMIGSVLAQTYPRFELCLADGSDGEHDGVEKICRGYDDPRIKYVRIPNGGISDNTNAAAELASGEWLALLDHDDALLPQALCSLVRCIEKTGAELVYSDEVTTESDLKRIRSVHFKPDCCPDNLRANNYFCHFTALTRELFNSIGGFRAELDGSQDHDLVLRASERAKAVAHIPEILYLWRASEVSVASDVAAKPYAVEAGKRAATESVMRAGLFAEVKSSWAHPAIYEIDYALGSFPPVSLITDGHTKGTDTLTYKNTELIKPESISEAEGEYLLFLSGERIVTHELVERLLQYAQREDTGAVGGMLIDRRGRVSSAGVILDENGLPFYPFAGCDAANEPGYMGRLCYAQDYPAVSGECLMIRKKLWERFAGESAGLSGELFFADLCLRLGEAGYKVVWTPFARVEADEPQRARKSEYAAFSEKWGGKGRHSDGLMSIYRLYG